MSREILNRSIPFVDHIVLLVPHKVLLNLPEWLTREFTVLPGGEHTDGLTANKLIVFEDGAYIEIIAFKDDADPERRKRHRWGQEPEGTIIDWACSLTDESGFDTIQGRVDSVSAKFHYADPITGGRVRPDGTELKWAVAVPVSGKEATAETSTATAAGTLRPGDMPFWCFDRTDRKLRVPVDDKANVRHQCGAVGVAGLSVASPSEEAFAAYATIYGTIFGSLNSKDGESFRKWSCATPIHILGDQPTITLRNDVRGKADEARIEIELFFLGSSDHDKIVTGPLGKNMIEIKLKAVKQNRSL